MSKSATPPAEPTTPDTSPAETATQTSTEPKPKKSWSFWNAVGENALPLIAIIIIGIAGYMILSLLDSIAAGKTKTTTQTTGAPTADLAPVIKEMAEIRDALKNATKVVLDTSQQAQSSADDLEKVIEELLAQLAAAEATAKTLELRATEAERRVSEAEAVQKTAEATAKQWEGYGAEMQKWYDGIPAEMKE